MDVQRDKCIITTNNRQYWQSGTTLPSVQQCVNRSLSDTIAVTLYTFSNSWFVKKKPLVSYRPPVSRTGLKSAGEGCFIRHSVIYVS